MKYSRTEVFTLDNPITCPDMFYSERGAARWNKYVLLLLLLSALAPLGNSSCQGAK